MLAAGAHEHAVLVVAEGARAQPQRAVLAVGVPLLLQQRQRVRHRARLAVVQRALIRPRVEAHAKARERGGELPDHDPHRRAAELRGIGAGGARHAVGEIGHVVALIAVLGDRLPARERPDRLAQLQHLRAGVVDVELAPDVVALQRQDPRERVAVGGVAGVTHVHRPRGVGGDELDQHPLGLCCGRPRRDPRPRPASGPARGQPGVGHEQIHEARASDLEALEARPQPRLQRASQPLGELARRHAGSRGQQQRRVGGVVAELRPARALERDLPARGAVLGELAGGSHYGAAQALQRARRRAVERRLAARWSSGAGAVMGSGAAVAILAV